MCTCMIQSSKMKTLIHIPFLWNYKTKVTELSI